MTKGLDSYIKYCDICNDYFRSETKFRRICNKCKKEKERRKREEFLNR